MVPRALLVAALTLLGSAARAEDGGLIIEEWGAPAAPTPADAQPPDGGLVIEAWGEPTATDAGSTGLEVEAFEPVADAAGPAEVEPPEQMTARVYGAVRSQVGVDTSFDSPRDDPLAENVLDLRTRAVLGLDARLSPQLRAVAEARVWWRVTSERAFDRAKGLFEVEAGEAFVDVYTKDVDLRVGNQVVAFGANLAFAPSDQLNPRDLREGFILGDPGDVKLPNFGARALGTLGKVTWTAAYFPFFRPNRYAVTGQDEALVQPALGLDIPREPDASIEDELQPHLLETERPKAFPWLGDLGLRATTEAGRFKVGASWVWVNEKTPMVNLDPELTSLLRSAARGNEPDPALAASIQERLIAGEELYTGTYPRQHVLGLEAQTLVRSAQLDVDVAYSPAQTLYASDLEPIRKATITWVLGVSQAEDSPLLYNVTYLGIAVPDLPSEGYLFLLEPATAEGAPRTVFFHALFATVGYRLMDDRLEVSVRGAVEPIQRSWALAPRVAWKGFQKVTLAVGAEFYEGKVYSPFGYFGRNDQVVAQLAVDLF